MAYVYLCPCLKSNIRYSVYRFHSERTTKYLDNRPVFDFINGKLTTDSIFTLPMFIEKKYIFLVSVVLLLLKIELDDSEIRNEGSHVGCSIMPLSDLTGRYLFKQINPGSRIYEPCRQKLKDVDVLG